jgi:hypothetical protein
MFEPEIFFSIDILVQIIMERLVRNCNSCHATPESFLSQSFGACLVRCQTRGMLWLNTML